MTWSSLVTLRWHPNIQLHFCLCRWCAGLCGLVQSYYNFSVTSPPGTSQCCLCLRFLHFPCQVCVRRRSLMSCSGIGIDPYRRHSVLGDPWNFTRHQFPLLFVDKSTTFSTAGRVGSCSGTLRSSGGVADALLSSALWPSVSRDCPNGALSGAGLAWHWRYCSLIESKLSNTACLSLAALVRVGTSVSLRACLSWYFIGASPLAPQLLGEPNWDPRVV